MNYPNTRVNVDITLLGMVCDAAGELEREGYLLEMTTSDNAKEVVSKYITVEEIKDYIKSTGNFVKDA